MTRRRERGADQLRRRLAPLVLAVFVALLLALAAAPAVAQAGLKQRIDGILVRYGLAGPRTAVRVWNLETGAQLYGRHTRTPLVPASNQKLVTAAAALRLWGPGHRFKTEVYSADAVPDADGVLHGSLWLKGYGDPTLSTASFQRHTLHLATSDIAHLVSALRVSGVRRVEGRVIADESAFDRARVVAGWKPQFVAFCGPLSALALDKGTIAGRRASQPALEAARELRRLLVAAGIHVTGGVALGTVPSHATLLHTELSAPLWRVLRAMNKASDNFIAEMLTKGLGMDFGGGGTTAAGVRVERSVLAQLGVDLDEVRLRDGSGLHYGDRLSAAAVTQLLWVMSADGEFDTYWSALPVAGVDGTLRTRMRGSFAAGNLRAKTGTLSIASSLSGYVSTADHQGLCFSVLMNGAQLDALRARRAQDAIGAALAASSP